jgi:hypothetical protein
MRQQLTDSARAWGGSKTIFFFREFLSNSHRILADGAKTFG